MTRRPVGGPLPEKRGDPEWSVYLVRCRDGSLYTGITKDVEKRLGQHNQGQGASYTRSRRPVRLVHREDGLTHSQALRREVSIKRLPKAEKEKMGEAPSGASRRSEMC